MFFVCKIVQIFSEKMHKIQGSMGYIYFHTLLFLVYMTSPVGIASRW